MNMHEIRLENYRCFRDSQTVPLAPLTLLVGENSAGKTSFLAMIQVLWDFAYGMNNPNFKKAPYDLGTFDEIAHYRGGRAGRANSFKAGFSTYIDSADGQRSSENGIVDIDVEFGRGPSTAPVPLVWTLSNSVAYVRFQYHKQDNHFSSSLSFGTSNGDWQVTSDSEESGFPNNVGNYPISQLPMILSFLLFGIKKGENEFSTKSLKGAKRPTTEDWGKLRELADTFDFFGFDHKRREIFASAPVRSKPHRTYDPTDVNRSPEGEYIPMYLANAFFENKNVWKNLRKSLVAFGKESGLYDDISVKPLGKKGSEPFQLQVRKFGSRAKGPSRNLIDVGYGVSQVLPLITELLHNRSSSMYLIQQPEVHLHPSAQAALGSLFCQAATTGQTLVVETHSDYILDRVRMEVRDGKSGLQPEDVSILFFEPKNLSARINPLRIDKEGNILDAPPHYRKFFMEETRRSLGL